MAYVSDQPSRVSEKPSPPEDVLAATEKLLENGEPVLEADFLQAHPDLKAGVNCLVNNGRISRETRFKLRDDLRETFGGMGESDWLSTRISEVEATDKWGPDCVQALIRGKIGMIEGEDLVLFSDFLPIIIFLRGQENSVSERALSLQAFSGHNLKQLVSLQIVEQEGPFLMTKKDCKTALTRSDTWRALIAAKD
jgi:hypothetical protein